MVVLITRFVEGTEPVCFEVVGGKAGVPIFYNVEDAQEFAEAYWELLGPGGGTRDTRSGNGATA